MARRRDPTPLEELDISPTYGPGVGSRLNPYKYIDTKYAEKERLMDMFRRKHVAQMSAYKLPPAMKQEALKRQPSRVGLLPESRHGLGKDGGRTAKATAPGDKKKRGKRKGSEAQPVVEEGVAGGDGGGGVVNAKGKSGTLKRGKEPRGGKEAKGGEAGNMNQVEERRGSGEEIQIPRMQRGAGIEGVPGAGVVTEGLPRGEQNNNNQTDRSLNFWKKWEEACDDSSSHRRDFTHRTDRSGNAPIRPAPESFCSLTTLMLGNHAKRRSRSTAFSMDYMANNNSNNDNPTNRSADARNRMVHEPLTMHTHSHDAEGHSINSTLNMDYRAHSNSNNNNPTDQSAQARVRKLREPSAGSQGNRGNHDAERRSRSYAFNNNNNNDDDTQQYDNIVVDKEGRSFYVTYGGDCVDGRQWKREKRQERDARRAAEGWQETTRESRERNANGNRGGSRGYEGREGGAGRREKSRLRKALEQKEALLKEAKGLAKSVKNRVTRAIAENWNANAAAGQAAKAKKKGAKEEETEIIEVDWGVPFVGHPRNSYPGYVPEPYE